MNDLETKAEEIRQMVLKLDEWYGENDYVSLSKNLDDGKWMAELIDGYVGSAINLPNEVSKYAESDWKPTAIEALESLREKLDPYVDAKQED